jgi:hypothetical protein
LIKLVSGSKKEDGTVAEDENVHTVNPFGIMQEIARSVYLEEVLLGKLDSPQRFEILSFIELAIRKSPEELAQLLNAHLELRMFIVGHSITAADILTLAHIADYFVSLFPIRYSQILQIGRSPRLRKDSASSRLQMVRPRSASTRFVGTSTAARSLCELPR